MKEVKDSSEYREVKDNGKEYRNEVRENGIVNDEGIESRKKREGREYREEREKGKEYREKE